MFKDVYGIDHNNFDDYHFDLIGPDCFNNKKTNKFYYHYYITCDYLTESKRAYYLKDPDGIPYWCPKKLWKREKIENNIISGIYGKVLKDQIKSMNRRNKCQMY